MKKIIISHFLIFVALVLQAQELPLQQYYLLNPLLLNPSSAGFSNQTDIRGSFSQQWIGIANAPSTQTISAHTNLGKGLGIGGYFYNDVNGLNRETGIQVAGAYHIKLAEEFDFLKIRQLSFGIGVTGFQHRISLTELTPHDYDPAVDGNEKSGSAIDFSAGVFTRYDRFFAGISVARLGAGKLSIYDDATEPAIPVFLAGNAGYDFMILENFILEPSVVYKLNTDNYHQTDLNIKTLFIPSEIWQYWVTISVRNGIYEKKSSLSNLVLLLGLHYQGLMFHYAYDLGLTSLAKSHNGSHQLMIGIQLPKSRQHKLICPVM